MERSSILREIFDEKIIEIINIFLENPRRHLSLTQTASLANVNIATTLRILDKLVKKDIIEQVVIGKSKFYKLKQSEKTLMLSRLLKKEEHLTEFLDRVKEIPRVSRVILETKSNYEAKLIIVGTMLPVEKIRAIAEDIRKKYHFNIQFVELSEKQYSEFVALQLYDLDKKVVWARGEE